MCILCVASRWSRRIVAMLPWLIIPLIILWALSQLLPPGFRFEVTSPRLACVGVLLMSLGWYELVMPRLSQWRSHRTVLLRERRRIEAQEAAKWRKEAIRRCRNCYYVYREQNPCGGKFTCTYCGHVSKRPVLDLPNSGQGMLGSSGFSGRNSQPSPSLGIWNVKSVKGAEVRGWMEKSDSYSGRGWTSKRSGTPGGGGGGGEGWGNASDSSSWSCWFATIWGALGLNWGAEVPGWGDNVGFWFKNEFCSPGEHGRLYYLFKYICLVFLMFKWVLTKRWIEETVSQDERLVRGQSRSQCHEEDLSSGTGSRGEKARRKAEERRLARLQRKQLEEEERKQREEVARLIEERRRLRDAKLEAERESEREAAAEREREIRREKEAERRRQEKAKEREKEKTKEIELDDARKRKENGKDTVKRCDIEQLDIERKGEHKAGSCSMSDLKKTAKISRGVGSDSGLKGLEFATKGVINSQKVIPPKYFSPAKNGLPAAAKGGGPRSSNTSFWGKGFNFVGRSAKGVSLSVTTSTSRGLLATDENIEKPASSYSSSAWNRMSWTKVWSKPVEQVQSSEENKRQFVPSDVEGASANSTIKDNIYQLQACEIKASESLTALLPITRSMQPQSIEEVYDKDNNLIGDNADPYFPGQKRVELLSSCLLPEPVVSPMGNKQAQESLACVTGSEIDPVHVPVSTSVLPPISAPQSSNHADASSDSSIFTPLDISNSFMTSNDSIAQTITSKDQPTSPLGPRIPRTPSSENLKDSSEEGKWEMWDAPQLSQIELPTLGETLQWSVTSPLSQLPSEPDNELPSCLFSPRQRDSILDESSVSDFGFLPTSAPTNHSLWSDQSAFQSALRIWEDPEIHRQVPPEFVDCITREIMLDPVITADGHSYERSAIESWLKTHDTSPKTGEVLPPPPGGDGTGVDKTLRPNHILRGQIIEYKERLARGSSAKRMGLDMCWAMFPDQDCPARSTDNTVPLTLLGGYYGIPGSQSLWAYDISSRG